MLQPALGDQGTSHQSRESPETPRYFLSSVVSLIISRPTFHLCCLLSSFPILHTPEPCTHTHRHTHSLMHITWGRCSLAPNVLWRPRSRPSTAAQRMSAPLHTCHTCARAHTATFSHMRARAHTDMHDAQQRGGVLWHLTSFGAPKTALWR